MNILGDVLLTEIFAFLMIFIRIGSAIMVMPGFGELFVSTRVRLVTALSIALVVTPMLGPNIPAIPDTMALLVVLIIKEVFVGVFIGFLMRVLTSAIHSAATMLAVQSGLANALFFDFSQSGQTTAVSNLMTFTGIVLIFAANLHHVMLTAVIESYTLMPVNQPIPIQDMAFLTASYLNKAFYVALKMAAPFIAMALITNTGAGVLSRLMPNFQVFFVLMAPQIWIAFFVLMIAAPAIMLHYLSYVEDGLTTLLIGL